MNEFEFRFWGVRGALASTSRDTVRYGANTACVEVTCGETTIVLDAGSGFRLLGNRLLADGRRRHAHLMFTHCHYDHISGLPFFAPFFSPDWHVDVWSGHLEGPSDEKGRRTREMVESYMRPPFFPVGPEVFTADVAYHDFDPGDRLLLPAMNGPGIAVRSCLLNHHDRAVAYRIDYEGRSLAYVTDTTHIPGKPDLTILAFIQEADAVIYDATYTDAEFPQFWNFGHSTWEEGARLCRAAGVKHYLPFHHRPSRSDADLDRLEQEARKVFATTSFAREGDRFRVGCADCQNKEGRNREERP